MADSSEGRPLVEILADQVAVPGTDGRIALSAFPGRALAGPGGRVKAADVERELEALRRWGAEVLVSLIEESELGLYGLPSLSGHIPAGMGWLRLPIADMEAPDAAWESAWEKAGTELEALLRRGGKIALHCIGGRGRSGTVAALILIRFGMDTDDAIKTVREARPGAIETDAQLDYLRNRPRKG